MDDTVMLDLGNPGKGEWQVVGLYEPVFAGTRSSENIYASQDALFEVTKKHNQGRTLYMRTREHDATRISHGLHGLANIPAQSWPETNSKSR